MPYIPRLVEADIQERIKNNKILIIMGARRVGKTTLVEHLLKEYSGKLLNMDSAVNRDQFERAASLTASEAVRTLTSGKLLAIDEAQQVPDIGRITKAWYDKHVPVKIILLGSASARELEKAAGALVGRNEKVWLTPLLFREILSRQDWFRSEEDSAHLYRFFPKQIEAMLMERMVYGGYPEAYLALDPVEYLTDLTADYLLKDVFASVSASATEDVRSLLVELANEAGQTISLLQLATRLKISRQTVRRYLQLLEEAFVVFSIRAYSTDSDKEMHRSKKYYFWDTGVQNAVLREWEVSTERSDIRQLWHSWLMAEIQKINIVFRHHREEMFFWQSRNGSTVDLVIKQGSKLYPFDFHFFEHEASPSRAFHNMYGLKAKPIHPGNVLEVLL